MISIKWYKVIWYILFNPKFRFDLQYTIKYGVDHHNEFYGSNASDCCIFKAIWWDKIIS